MSDPNNPAAPAARTRPGSVTISTYLLYLVAAIFGDGSLLSRTVYVLVGLSAIWQIVALATAPSDAVSTGRREHSVR